MTKEEVTEPEEPEPLPSPDHGAAGVAEVSAAAIAASQPTKEMLAETQELKKEMVAETPPPTRTTAAPVRSSSGYQPAEVELRAAEQRLLLLARTDPATASSWKHRDLNPSKAEMKQKPKKQKDEQREVGPPRRRASGH